VPLRHQREDVALARRELVERPRLARPVEQAVDDRRVQHALAAGDAPQRVAQHARVADALLQEVAGAGRIAREQRRGVARVQVARQQQHRRAGMALADLGRRAQALVGVGSAAS
jgi:hypothetical protein